MRRKSTLLIYLFFLLISIILSIIWFHKGLIVALGESAIPFYSPQNVLYFYGQTWVPINLGYFPGTTISSIPFFTVANWLWQLSLPGYVVQAIYFGLFAFIGLLGGYLLYANIFTEKDADKRFIGFVGGLFYLLNLISLVIAFNRLQYPFIMFYLSLPYALLFFILGILKKKLRYILYFNFVLLPFVMAFGGLPFIELLWGLLGSYVLFVTIVNWKRREERYFPIIFFILCLLLWTIFNIWWLMQIIQYALFTPHPAYSIKGDIGTFTILSDNQGNLSYVLRLMNKHFLQSMIPTWGNYYFTPFFTFLSYLLPVFAFLPLLLKRKPLIIYYFLGLVLFTLFLTKGSAGPFGGVFLFLFSYITVLEVFRNSFEKIGMLLPLAYAPLIGYSVYILMQRLLKTHRKRIVYTVIIVLGIGICGVLVYPFWNGLVFTYNLPPANNPKIGDYIEVPSYYKNAKEYLDKDTGDYRVLALPMGGEGITYDWPHPYNGVEYSNGLFAKPFISYNTIMPYLDVVATQLNYSFARSPQTFINVMNVLDAKYLMIRSDIDYKARLMPNPSDVVQFAKKNPIDKLQFQNKFDKLIFYKNLDNPQKVYAINDIYAAPSTIFFSDVFSLTKFKKNDAILNINNTDQQDSFALKTAKTSFIEPITTIDFTTYPEISLDSAQSLLPTFYRFLPGSPMYNVIYSKEKVLRYFTIDIEDKMFYDLDSLTRRLGEMQHMALNRDSQNFQIAVAHYVQTLDYILKNRQSLYGSEVIKNINTFRYRIMAHKLIINNLLKTIPEKSINNLLKKTQTALDRFAIETYIVPKFENPHSDEKTNKRIVYEFTVPQSSRYRVLLRKDDFTTYYTNSEKPWEIFVNNTLIHVTPTSHDGWFDFGEYELEKGRNELHLFNPIAKNVIAKDSSEIVKVVSPKNGEIKKMLFPLQYFDPYSPYKVTFSYRLDKTGGAKVEAQSELDQVLNGVYQPEWSSELSATLGDTWREVSYVFYPYSTANKQSIALYALSVNTCLVENQYNAFNIDRCKKDKRFRDSYNQQSAFEFKDVVVQKVFSNKLILSNDNSSYKAWTDIPTITYTSKKPTEYSVHISNAKKPYILVFSETYYPEWHALYKDTNQQIGSSNHFLANGYANAWYINRKGDYIITISFGNERLFTIGKMISIPAMIFFGIMSLYYLYKTKKRT